MSGKFLLSHLSARIRPCEPIDIYSLMYGLLSNWLFKEGLTVSGLIASRTICLHL